MNIGLKRSTLIILFFIAILLVATFIPLNTTYADVIIPYSLTHYIITNLPESHYVYLYLGETEDPGSTGYLAPNIPREEYQYGPSSENYESLILGQTNRNKAIDRLNQEDFDYYFTKNRIFGGEELTTSIDYYYRGHNSSKHIFIIYDADNDILYRTDKVQKHVYFESRTASYPDDIVSVNSNTYTIVTEQTTVQEKSPQDEAAERIAAEEAKQKAEDLKQTILIILMFVVITVAVELSIAFCFKFTKKSYLIIAITNVITQIIVNVVMWLSMEYGGETWDNLDGFLVAEAFVLIAEPLIYRLTCERKNGTKKLIVLYGIIANIVTIGIGFLISYIITLL